MDERNFIDKIKDHYERTSNGYFPYTKEKMIADAEAFLNLIQIGNIPSSVIYRMEPSISHRDTTTVYIEVQGRSVSKNIKTLLSIAGFIIDEHSNNIHIWFKL